MTIRRRSTAGLLALAATLVASLGAAWPARPAAAQPAQPVARHAGSGIRRAIAKASAHTQLAWVASVDDLRVAGNRLVNGADTPVRILGVSRSGTEYACSQGWGVFDGPSDGASIEAMRTWDVNVVRVPLNEDCWLGINGLDPSFAGSAYRRAIEGWVTTLRARGMGVILDLHWTAPGTSVPAAQAPMPDAAHSAAFWRSVASAFRADRGVAYELYNEPRNVTWSCWVKGCTAPGYQDGTTMVAPYAAVGMQQLIDAVRSTGSRQAVLVEGLDWGNDLSGVLTHPLEDPATQLAYAWHVYSNSGCATVACWTAEVVPVAAHFPVLITEFGEYDCGSAFVDSVMSWADQHDIGYMAWAWDTWSGCGGPSLLSSFDGTPNAFGRAIQGHFRAVAAR